MPITGSDMALMQARSAIARCGATRSGYYIPNLVIQINGVDRTSAIEFESLQIEHALNDEPDTATFVLLPTAAVVPTIGQLVVIGLGTIANREFGGQIVAIQHRRRLHDHAHPWIEVQCVDYGGRLLDRRLVTTEWFSTSATQIAKDIIDTYTSGFTRLNIAPDLAEIDHFPATNAKPSELLRRLAAAVGGGFYVDADRDVHLFGSTGEPRPLTAPRTLTGSLASLKSFTHTADLSQVRTKTWVEGTRTFLLTAVPAGATSMPIADASAFLTFGLGGPDYLRIGQEVLFLNVVASIAPIIPAVTSEFRTVNDATAVLSADASVGATSLSLTVPSTWGSGLNTTTWAQVGEQFVYFTAYGGGGTTITGIPASGYGSIQTDLKAGMTVKILDAIVHFASGVSTALDHRAGEDVVMRVVQENFTQQTNLATAEGGDGVHEHIVSDGRLTQLGVYGAADADVERFALADGLFQADWETEDLNAKVGRPQAINFSAPDALSTTLTITRTSSTFPIQNYRPRRRCQAGTVKTASMIEAIVTEQN